MPDNPDDGPNDTHEDTGPAAMWKGSSERLELGDRVDFIRADLFAAFEEDPLGRHDLELQLLVSGVRGSPRIPRFVLARVAPGRWQVIRIAAQRGGSATLVGPRVFDDLRAAERYVFGLRLQLLGALDAAGADPTAASAPAAAAAPSMTAAAEVAG